MTTHDEIVARLRARIAEFNEDEGSPPPVYDLPMHDDITALLDEREEMKARINRLEAALTIAGRYVQAELGRLHSRRARIVVQRDLALIDEALGGDYNE